MMRVLFEALGHDAVEAVLDLARRFSGREAAAVREPEDVGVDRNCGLAEDRVEHHVRGLAADSGKRLERRPIVRHLTAMLLDQRPAERDHVLGLRIEETDGLDVLLEPRLAEREHCGRRLDLGEERLGRLVDALVGRLRGEDHGDQKRIGVPVVELGGWRLDVRGEPLEELGDLGLLHGPCRVSRRAACARSRAGCGPAAFRARELTRFRLRG